MKKIRIMVAAICILMFFSIQVTAQNVPLILDLNYNYSIPVSGFKTDLISNNSSRGFRGELMYPFNDKLEAGILFGYQDYYQKYPRTLYNISKTQDISAVISNSIQTTPVLLKAKYFPLNSPVIKPYISVGAGATLIDFAQYYGEFGGSQTNVGFIAQGGLGAIIPFGKLRSSGINLGATYDYAPYKKYGYSDLNSVNLQAGLMFKIK